MSTARTNTAQIAIGVAAALLLPVFALAGAPGPDTDAPVASPAIPINTVPVNTVPVTDTTPIAPNMRPAEFTIDYKLRYAAFSAELRLSLRDEPDNDDFVITATTRARGLAKVFVRGTMREQARFSYVAGRVESSHYILDSGKKSGEDSGEVSFDWEQMKADSMYEGSSETLALDTDVYDRISSDVAVIMDLRNGKQPQKLRIAEKNQLRDYVFTYQGEGRIETAAGEFDTVRYLRQRPGSSRSTMVWYARDAGYLPVRVEQLKRGETVVTSEATALTLADT